MAAVRFSACSVRPFDESSVIYLHCIDLQTKEFTPVTSFACLEIYSVLGHFSFPRNLALRRLCCFLWSEETEAKLMACQSPVLLNVKSSCYFTESDGRNICIVVDFELVGASSGIAKLPKPKSIDELEHSSEVDALKCCPWLNLTRCNCNCTNFPALGNVLVKAETTFPAANASSDSSESEEDDLVTFFEDQVIDHGEDGEQSDEGGEKSPTLYTEYVALRGSSFHEDCQATLRKCRDLLCDKKTVELRIVPEPENIRDCNALIIQARVDCQWDRIGYIPKEKVPKFTAALTENEVREIKFKNIKSQYVFTDKPTWMYAASVVVIKIGKWLPNDDKYRYNDSI